VSKRTKNNGPSIRRFVENLNSDDEFRNQFFTSDDPVEFLKREAGITVEPSQRNELKALLRSYKKKFPMKLKLAIGKEDSMEIDIYLG
jgi:hypothetical protein